MSKSAVRIAAFLVALETWLAILVALTVAHCTGCAPAEQKVQATYEFMGPGGTPGQVQINGGNNLFEGAAPTVVTGYLTGTAYTLTGTSAAIAGGTTSPSITLSTPGTYQLAGRFNAEYVAATNGGAGTVTVKFRNTTTSTDYGHTTITTQAVTSITGTLSQSPMPSGYTVTVVSGTPQTIQLWGAESSATGVEIVEAEVTATLIR